jgi:hypothetical protein
MNDIRVEHASWLPLGWLADLTEVEEQPKTAGIDNNCLGCDD